MIRSFKPLTETYVDVAIPDRTLLESSNLRIAGRTSAVTLHGRLSANCRQKPPDVARIEWRP